MTARTFYKEWKRAHVLEITSGVLGILFSFTPLVILTFWDPAPVRAFFDSARHWAGDEGTYGAIVALLMIATWLPFFATGIAPMLWLDRRFGVRCNHCNRKLLVRWRLHEVLRTGRCCWCSGYLFDPDAELATETAPDPAKTVWVYTTISGILILVVLATRSHVVHEGWVFAALATSLMASWTGAGVGLCDSIRCRSPRIWLATAIAMVAAGCAAILVWYAANGQGFFEQSRSNH